MRIVRNPSMRSLIVGIVACAWLLYSGRAEAHPHMFLESRAEFAWKGQALSGVWLEWTWTAISAPT
jgi:ABC-type uncharacterized transport system substrate-binding protein